MPSLREVVSRRTPKACPAPAGLITAIQYAGVPNRLQAMGPAMAVGMTMPAGSKPLDFLTTVILGLIAGLTIFVGLPIARTSKLSPYKVGLLNALAIGILLYLVIEIAQNAIIPISQGVTAWHSGAGSFPAALIVVFVIGLLTGLVGLGSAATMLTKRAAKKAENPLVLAAIIAIGIGANAAIFSIVDGLLLKPSVPGPSWAENPLKAPRNRATGRARPR